MKYRPNPKARIHAVEWTGNVKCLPLAWRRLKMLTVNADGTLTILTQHGPADCEVGDYIARGMASEFYPIQKLVFPERWVPANLARRWLRWLGAGS